MGSVVAITWRCIMWRVAGVGLSPITFTPTHLCFTPSDLHGILTQHNERWNKQEKLEGGADASVMVFSLPSSRSHGIPPSALSPAASLPHSRQAGFLGSLCHHWIYPPNLTCVLPARGHPSNEVTPALITVMLNPEHPLLPQEAAAPP